MFLQLLNNLNNRLHTGLSAKYFEVRLVALMMVMVPGCSAVTLCVRLTAGLLRSRGMPVGRIVLVEDDDHGRDDFRQKQAVMPSGLASAAGLLGYIGSKRLTADDRGCECVRVRIFRNFDESGSIIL